MQCDVFLIDYYCTDDHHQQCYFTLNITVHEILESLSMRGRHEYCSHGYRVVSFKISFTWSWDILYFLLPFCILLPIAGSQRQDRWLFCSRIIYDWSVLSELI